MPQSGAKESLCLSTLEVHKPCCVDLKYMPLQSELRLLQIICIMCNVRILCSEVILFLYAPKYFIHLAKMLLLFHMYVIPFQCTVSFDSHPDWSSIPILPDQLGQPIQRRSDLPQHMQPSIGMYSNPSGACLYSCNACTQYSLIPRPCTCAQQGLSDQFVSVHLSVDTKISSLSCEGLVESLVRDRSVRIQKILVST